MPFADYLREAVLEPLGMARSELRGLACGRAVGAARRPAPPRPRAAGADDRRAGDARRGDEVAFPGLDGVLPDFGRMTPNDWGLGFEIRDAKPGHWMGDAVSPRAFGHFGGSGTFLWVDPELGAALGVLTDLEFGEWAKEALAAAVGRGAVAELTAGVDVTLQAGPRRRGTRLRVWPKCADFARRAGWRRALAERRVAQLHRWWPGSHSSPLP